MTKPFLNSQINWCQIFFPSPEAGHTSIDYIGKKKVFSSFGYMRFRSNRKWENLGLCFTDCPIFEVKNCSESSSSCDLACARFGCSSFQSF